MISVVPYSTILLQLAREYALRRRTLHSAVLRKQRMYGASDSEKYLSSVVSVQSQWASERARAAALLLERDLGLST